LIGLEGYLRTSESEYTEIDMNYFFPDQKQVFAEWFCGEIRVPLGKEIHYVHMGYESMYERDLIIHIKEGVVIRRIEINNV